MNKINLFCLPFAGGSKYSYRGYVTHAPANLNVIPVELRGRGTRFKEPLQTNAHDMAEDVLLQISSQLEKPYAIYGHSMGSLIGYLLAKRILEKNLPPPLHLFLTGAGGPSTLNKKREKTFHLSSTDFFNKIKELGGVNDEIIENKDLKVFFEPILRADFQVVETYRHEASEPFDIPITSIIGIHEKTTYEDALCWQQETTAPVEVRQLPGKHFFIFDYESDIIRLINNQILKNTKIVNNEQSTNVFKA